MVAAEQTSVELARLAGRPDFRPMASYNSMWNTGAHRWMVGLGLSLPVWRERVRAGVAAAEADLDATDQRLVALEDSIGAEVKTAVDRFEESRHVVALFTDRLLPAARDQVAAARSGFETGQVDFLAVIDAERNLRDIELGLALARAQYQQRLAQLQRTVGLPPGTPWPTTASHRSPMPRAGGSAPASNLSGAGRPGRMP
jgi:outer membrane protein TolC